MQLRIHAFVQDSDDFDKVAFDNSVVHNVHWLFHTRNGLALPSVSEMETADAGAQGSAVSGQRSIGLIRDYLHRPFEQSFVSVFGPRSP